ncbi:SDR family oxidoreductase [Bradyrhizobium sp. 190]|uniref:SDR family oxidoreductase n=1 Tax=Bradyrhizobium sp. 190 TaxID=2782658 RepID=UPI001FFAFAF0|nr:SDR family oxidoreductase [Bradyrhizobium sp. 190]MCK1518491.1 SDR family oxidoreductase [Bradyrhizobium sp. 190]
MSRYQQVRESLQAEPKRWLITGVAGFIGSNLLEELLRLDQTVIGLDNFSTGRRRNLEEVRSSVTPIQFSRFRVIEGDVVDARLCREAVAGVDYVLHQAALGSVPWSISDPVTTNLVNVDGFLNMLVASRDASVRRFVFAASSSTYGDHVAPRQVEHVIGRPLSPYAVTKLVNELYADVFSKNFSFHSIGLRYFNIFGRRQDPKGPYSAVIPRWTDAMIAGDVVEIYGDGEASRDFCHVENVVQANILAATIESSDATNQIYNVALGRCTSLNELFGMIQGALVPHCPDVKDLRPVYREPRAGDIVRSSADISKAQRLLGYEPTRPLDVGLAETSEWYLAKRAGLN